MRMKRYSTVGEVRATDKSIKHWIRDIWWPLRKGAKVIDAGGERIWDARDFMTTRLVPMFGDNCPLCQLVMDKEVGHCRCWMCPVVLTGERTCNTGVWREFSREPTLPNAVAMVNTLKKVKKELISNLPTTKVCLPWRYPYVG